MGDFAILNSLITDSAKVQLESGPRYSFVTLTEPDSPESEVRINGLPSDTIVIKVDAFKSPDAIFAGTKNECKRADYIIVANKNGKKNILHIELKTSSSSEGDRIKQLKGSACFISYCQEIAKEFWHENKLLYGFKPRFVSFTHTTGSIRKRSTQATKKMKLNDKPENLMKVSHTQKAQFDMLVGS